MKLSQDAQRIAEFKINNEIERLSSNLQTGITITENTTPRGGERYNQLIRKYLETINLIAQVMVEIYIKYYEEDETELNPEDIQEITDKINLRANQTSHNFSGGMTMINGIDRAVGIARKNLIEKMEDKKFEKAIKEKKKMNEQLLVETEKKRYQLLRKIFEKTKGNSLNFISFDQLQKEEGLMQEEFFTLTDYLKNEGLVSYPVLGSITITHRGVKEIEASVRNPNKATEHFTHTVIQNFHGNVYGVQTGDQNTQNIQVNNPEFNENLSKLIELIKESSLTEVQREETIEDLERVGKLAQKEKTPDVLEAAKKRLDLVKTSIDIATNIGPTAITCWQYLYHWFQS
jgi:hypothetical protein